MHNEHDHTRTLAKIMAVKQLLDLVEESVRVGALSPEDASKLNLALNVVIDGIADAVKVLDD